MTKPVLKETPCPQLSPTLWGEVALCLTATANQGSFCLAMSSNSSWAWPRMSLFCFRTWKENIFVPQKAFLDHHFQKIVTCVVISEAPIIVQPCANCCLGAFFSWADNFFFFGNKQNSWCCQVRRNCLCHLAVSFKIFWSTTGTSAPRWNDFFKRYRRGRSTSFWSFMSSTMWGNNGVAFFVNCFFNALGNAKNHKSFVMRCGKKHGKRFCILYLIKFFPLHLGPAFAS